MRGTTIIIRGYTWGQRLGMWPVANDHPGRFCVDVIYLAGPTQDLLPCA
ncbi:hypothetical protein AIGOOFII_1906 [Methylobacterium marchantiae]|uniref:Uncharacterized protein n=1 Tax=Methylobacterium bullatum TaxID=570505 RepID=A0A679JFA3_9HYPH|nr:hypothetical protein OICFNHDK_4347 [Methylobacterium bullatum]GJE17193.1 hypothetical protein AIGOOFII_1906 [Methylobacterium marchantiae]CAA2104561.1 hypothetical protein MBUL_02765 [Methylobacterium bullatum]